MHGAGLLKTGAAKLQRRPSDRGGSRHMSLDSLSITHPRTAYPKYPHYFLHCYIFYLSSEYNNVGLDVIVMSVSRHTR